MHPERKAAGLELLKSTVLVGLAFGVVILGIRAWAHHSLGDMLGSVFWVKKQQTEFPNRAPGGNRMADTIHEFKMETANGEERSLADYKGKALLIVNTASKCGLTPQYASLEKLREKYAARGFEVLAFPANDFLRQEPGSNEEIQKFCEVNYAVTFPVFAKLSVKGGEIAPLYSYLTKDSGFPGDIEWNFAKFLVAPDGKVVARFNSKVDPLAPEIVQQVEQTLPD